MASDDTDEDRLQESIDGDDTSDAFHDRDADSDEDDFTDFEDDAKGGVTSGDADAGAL